MTEQSPLWPYSERNAAAAERSVALLTASPESVWDDAEREHLREFAAGLFEGGFEVEKELPRLDEVYEMSVGAATQTYYLDYFHTAEGRSVLSALQVDDKADSDTIRRVLSAAVATGDVPDRTVRKKIANDSQNWYKAELARRVTTDGVVHGMAQEDSPKLTINYAPDKLLTKFEQLQAYRTFYRKVRQAVSEEEATPFRQAQQALLDVYVARVNSLVAELYPATLQLAEQLSISPSTERIQNWQRHLFAVAPVIRRAFQNDKDDRQGFVEEFARRLDLVRNGAEAVGQQAFSPIASQVRQLADELETALPEAAPEPQVPAELVEKLADTRWQATQLQDFCQAILGDWQLLSNQVADWQEVEERSGPASDGRWQVVVTPKVTSLSTNGAKKVVNVPESFDRTLSQVSPAGALPVTAHELTHVLQAEYDQEVAKQIPLARIKGRRYVTGREMGGIYEERRLQNMLGQARPTNTTYLRALEAKLAGGNQTESARAFLEASLGGAGQNSAEAPRTKAVTAGRNVLRLYRHAGYDSQALDYIEQELLLRSMDRLPADQVRAIAIAGGSFSLPDAAVLHQIGLLELPNELLHKPAEDVLRVYLGHYRDREE